MYAWARLSSRYTVKLIFKKKEKKKIGSSKDNTTQSTRGRNEREEESGRAKLPLGSDWHRGCVFSPRQTVKRK